MMTEEKIVKILKQFQQQDYKRGGVSIDPSNYNAIARAVVKNCSMPDVNARYSLKDMEQIFFAGYFHPPIKNDETEEGLDLAFKAVIDRHNSNVR